MGIRAIGFVLLGAALILTGLVWYRNSHRSEVPLVFSPTQVLNAVWERYTQNYLEPGSYRTLDKQRDNITTSEGQSYTLLRAVWIGDKATFDHVWQFTKDDLQHQSDSLFSWLFGKRPDGSYGVLTAQGGDHTASDADQDIALSLVFAYARWQDPAYLSEAKRVISDIWEKEVIIIGGVPYLTADNLEKNSNGPVALINPSYLAPYEYRIFAEVDPSHPWKSVADSSYTVLQKSMSAALGSSKSAGLPPDWVAINKTTGALSAASASGTDTNFSYDAMRVPFRLALDYQWFGDARDLSILRSMQFLSTAWSANGALASSYTHGGSIMAANEAPSIYGGTIGYFMFADKEQAQKVYEDKLVFLYDPDLNAWKETLPYYDDNWAWFGIALYNELLPNLAAGLPPSAFK